MLDKLFFLSLILNATELFRFLAPQFDVSIAVISVGLLAINAFYLVARLPYTALAFRPMAIWLVLLTVWPLATAAYAPVIDSRAMGLAVYHTTLLYATVVYVLANGLPSMHRMLAIALGLSVLGLILSMVAPQYFASVARLADTRNSYFGRAYGFFMQPNRCGISLCVLFIGWFALWKRNGVYSEPIALLVFLAMLLLTGSRTAVLLGAAIVVFHLAYQWSARQSLTGSSRYYSRRMIVFCICIACGLGGARMVLRLAENRVERRSEDLIERASTLLAFRLSSGDSLDEDTSLNARLDIQSLYWTAIWDRPLRGYGIGTEEYFYDTGTFHRTSHSTLLTTVLEYGWLYVVVFILAILRLYSNRFRAKVEAIMETNAITQFLAAFLLLFLIAGDILSSRAFFIVWGVFLASVVLYEHNTEQQTIRLPSSSGTLHGPDSLRRPRWPQQKGADRLSDTAERSSYSNGMNASRTK